MCRILEGALGSSRRDSEGCALTSAGCAQTFCLHGERRRISYLIPGAVGQRNLAESSRGIVGRCRQCQPSGMTLNSPSAAVLPSPSGLLIKEIAVLLCPRRAGGTCASRCNDLIGRDRAMGE